ncbi:unnamed protein product [Heligmosomoides polygyrus]|uniref:ANF_receptor domain-containing protein n=1 Tax=Heligmosomoides polygyrus TaxID=6339 RepID=A0A183GQT1_HELPZ|nr:unnamed protein product [Heligmosomoides polygyrus]
MAFFLANLAEKYCYRSLAFLTLPAVDSRKLDENLMQIELTVDNVTAFQNVYVAVGFSDDYYMVSRGRRSSALANVHIAAI